MATERFSVDDETDRNGLDSTMSSSVCAIAVAVFWVGIVKIVKGVGLAYDIVAHSANRALTAKS